MRFRRLGGGGGTFDPTSDIYMRLRSSSPDGEGKARSRFQSDKNGVNVFHSTNVLFFWLVIWFLLVHKQRSKCCLSFETYKGNKEREEEGGR